MALPRNTNVCAFLWRQTWPLLQTNQKPSREAPHSLYKLNKHFAYKTFQGLICFTAKLRYSPFLPCTMLAISLQCCSSVYKSRTASELFPFNWHDNSKSTEQCRVTVKNLILKFSTNSWSKSHSLQRVYESTAHQQMFAQKFVVTSQHKISNSLKFNFVNDHDLDLGTTPIWNICWSGFGKRKCFCVRISFT